VYSGSFLILFLRTTISLFFTGYNFLCLFLAFAFALHSLWAAPFPVLLWLLECWYFRSFALAFSPSSVPQMFARLRLTLHPGLCWDASSWSTVAACSLARLYYCSTSLSDTQLCICCHTVLCSHLSLASRTVIVRESALRQVWANGWILA
jgi:hypothetical protein